MSVEAEVRELKEGGGANNGALEAELITDATQEPEPEPAQPQPETETVTITPENPLLNLFPH